MATFNGIEISIKLRPCWVDGQKALFHQWITDERIIVDVKSFMKMVEFRSLAEDIRNSLSEKTGVLPPIQADIYKHKENFALVEFEDGKVERVEPEKIRFADTQGTMAEIAWPEPEEG